MTRADRGPIRALIAANLLPVVGVLFLDWEVLTLLLAYWLENLVLGLYTVLRMVRVGGPRALLEPGLFFVIHYGFFCAGHGLVLIGIGHMAGLPDDVLAPYADPIEWPGPLWMLQQMIATLRWIAHEHSWMLVSALGFLASHGISLVAHHFVRNEDRGRDPQQIMWDPYKRIVVLHLSMIVGMFLVIPFGGGSIAPVLLVLVTGKIALDVHLHRKAHRARQATAEGPPSGSARD